MRYVVWDWNGTLLDDLECAIAATNRLLEEFELPRLTGIDAYHQVFRFPVRDYYADLGFDTADGGNFEAASRRFHQLYLAAARDCELHTGARSTLATLHRAGVTQVLISASEQSNLGGQVAPFGLDGWLTQILGLGDIYAASKLALARDWLERVGADPDDVLFVGDSTHDFEIANALGAHCALYTRGHQARSRLEQLPASVIDELGEVIDLALGTQSR
jgi:Predicted phosphatases